MNQEKEEKKEEEDLKQYQELNKHENRKTLTEDKKKKTI